MNRVDGTENDKSCDASEPLTRRRFIQVSAGAAGGLLLGTYLPQGGRLAQAASADDAPGEASGRLNLWLHIDQNNQVTISIPAVEMGQGVYTSLAMLVAEELDVDWRSVKAEMAPVNDAFTNTLFGMQATGGSTSIRWAFEPLGHVGASARTLLVNAAARLWDAQAADCLASKGTVIHQVSGRVLRYRDLLDTASKMAAPEQVTLKSPEQWELLGTAVKRLDTPMKVNGSAVFGIDVDMPDLLVATVSACPTVGGTLESVDETPALAVSGVLKVLSLDDAVVVVGTGYWPVKKAIGLLSPEWQAGDNAGRNTDSYRQELSAALASPGMPVRTAGNVDEAFADAANVVEATYEVPHLAHATMEPMNATAWVRPDSAEIWAPTQAPGMIRQVAAGMLGMPPENVTVHTTFLGGGFGRRFEMDFVVQVLRVSQMMGKPVKLVWSREEDTRHDFYRPAAMSNFKAALDDDGYPTAWHNRMASPSIMTRVFPNMIKDGIDAVSVEGAGDLPFKVPNQRIEAHIVDTGLPVGFWRSVGHSQNAFFVQSFVDELAASAGIDPYVYQMRLLENRKRHLGVLSAAVAMAQWPNRSAERPMGLAVHESFGSFCALVVQLLPVSGKELHISRISAAVDCGVALNPDTVVAQIESAIVYGLTAALYGDISIEDGAVVESNFTDYPMLKLAQMPEVNVEIVNSGEAVGGIGEPGLPPLAPALTNAVFFATGERIRRLPLTRSGFSLV